MLALAAACGGGGGSGDDDDDGAADAGPDGSGDPDAAVLDQPPLTEGLATLAGAGLTGEVDGDRNHALFDNPVNVVVADDGNLIVADFDNSLIRRVTPTGEVTTLSEPPLEGMFVRPFGLILSGDTLFVQTDANSLGQQPLTGALWSMPISGGAPVLVHDNIGRARGMAELGDGRMVLSDYQGHVVQVYDPNTGVATILAGVMNAPGYRDGSADGASFDQPYDVLLMPDGTLLVADFGNNRLRQVAMDGTVTTFAGTGVAGRDDGTLETATFNAPQGLALDSAGNIYVTDAGNFLIRRISPDGQVTTVAGDGTPGYQDSEDPLSGRLFGIEGADVGPDGYLYIADGTHGETAPYHRIRRLTIQ